MHSIDIYFISQTDKTSRDLLHNFFTFHRKGEYKLKTRFLLCLPNIFVMIHPIRHSYFYEALLKKFLR